MLTSIFDEQPAAFPRQRGLEGSTGFMKSRMNHTAVEAGRLFAHRGMLFESCNGQPSLGQLARDGAAYNAAGSYDAGVVHRSGKSVKTASA